MGGHDLSLLGRGTYGEVFFDHAEGVAVKRMKHTASGDEGVSVTALREARILHQLRHPRVMSLLDVRLANDHVYLVAEYLPRSLRQVLDAGLMCARAIACASADLFEALAFCHAHHVMHRDVKPDNLLFDHANRLKLADFGLAREALGGDGGAEAYTPQMVTLWYRAPEVLREGEYSFGVDVWSAGCVVAEMQLGRTLFPGESEIGMLKLIETTLRAFDELFDEDAPASDLVRACLLPPRPQRIRAAEALKMPFLQTGARQTPSS